MCNLCNFDLEPLNPSPRTILREKETPAALRVVAWNLGPVRHTLYSADSLHLLKCLHSYIAHLSLCARLEDFVLLCSCCLRKVGVLPYWVIICFSFEHLALRGREWPVDLANTRHNANNMSTCWKPAKPLYKHKGYQTNLKSPTVQTFFPPHCHQCFFHCSLRRAMPGRRGGGAFAAKVFKIADRASTIYI